MYNCWSATFKQVINATLVAAALRSLHQVLYPGQCHYSLTGLYFLQSCGHKLSGINILCTFKMSQDQLSPQLYISVLCLTAFPNTLRLCLHFQFVKVHNSVYCSVQWHTFETVFLYIHYWRFCSITVCHLTGLFCVSGTNHKLP